MFVEQSVCCESTKRFCLSYAVCIVSMIRNNSQNREIEYIGKPVREFIENIDQDWGKIFEMPIIRQF